MSKISPITVELVNESLVAIVREMRGIIFRTARSVAIYEAKDFSCGIFNAKGEVLAQSEDIGGHIIPLPWHVRAVLEAFPQDINPGDVFMLNDPYCGGTHLNDVTLVYPIYYKDHLAFFAAVREHWSDVGGSVPGSLSGAARDIYQEGVRIPPLRIIDRGTLNKAAFDLMLANMRVKDERRADFFSGISACHTAEKRLELLLGKIGIEVVNHAVEINIDRSEARMRAQISRLPPGTYFFEDYLEFFTPDGLEPLLMPLELTIDGDTIRADFTGASPQVGAPVNTTLAVTSGGVLIALKSILDPGITANHGVFRPVTIVAPAGTIVNVTQPAPVGSHGEVRKRVMGVVTGALSQAAPNLVAADTHRTSFHNMIGGWRPDGGEYVHYEWGSGGNGGYRDGDGASAMGAVDWGGLFTVQSTEVLERQFPLRIESSQLACDSGGPGKFRGGLALQRKIRILEGSATYSLLADGAIVPPYGVNGGYAALPIDVVVDRGGKVIHFDTPGKIGGFQLDQQDLLVTQAAGGGGYGDPIERPTHLVLHDVAEGYVSEASARQEYGVCFTSSGDVAADDTRTLRETIARNRVHLTVDLREGDGFLAGKHSRRRVYHLHPDDVRALNAEEDALLEIVGSSGAPLRGWCRTSNVVRRGIVPLDERAMQILQCRQGSRVAVRTVRLAAQWR